VLISSAGRRVALLESFETALRSLGVDGDVLAIDRSPYSACFQRATRRFLAPPCSSPEFLPFVLELCQREHIRLVVPTIDPELPIYAHHRAEFERVGTTVAVSGPATVAVGADKVATHAWLVDHGLPTVEQVTPDDVGNAVGPAFPVIVKPRFGSSSVGVAVVADRDELHVAMRAQEVVVQSVATGAEYTIDALVDRSGACVCVVPRRRLEVRAGEVSKAVTERHSALEDLVLRMAAALPDAYGPLTFQVFVGEDDRMQVIELNPRFGGGFPLAAHAGADHPRWMLEELLGLPSSADGAAWRDGVVMLRYDEAVFVAERQLGEA
jgi:carbamoyl-phosphate synthase large subunit